MMKDRKMSQKSNKFFDRVKSQKCHIKKGETNMGPQHLGILKSLSEDFHHSASSPGKGKW